MSFIAVSAGVAVAGGIYSIGKGISQNSQASKIEAANQRPTYQIPDEFKQNQVMAAHMAQTGMPQQQYDNSLNNINRNQAGGLYAMGRNANMGSLTSLVRAGNDATNNLDANDAAQRQNNQRYSIEQNGIMGNQELAAQQYNKFDKYTENFNKAQALRGAASDNINNGVNSASGMAMGLASTYKVGAKTDPGAIKTVLPGATLSPGSLNPALKTQANPVGFNNMDRNGMPWGPQWNPFGGQQGYQKQTYPMVQNNNGF